MYLLIHLLIFVDYQKVTGYKSKSNTHSFAILNLKFLQNEKTGHL